MYLKGWSRVLCNEEDHKGRIGTTVTRLQKISCLSHTR